ncbi:MAG: alanine racemase [Rhodocyclaceae bacterium]|nr:alanine racemase [Rhodocyclaceae bacterium]
MSRPVRARIDLAALRGNFAVARRHAAGAKLWAVVKAEAYGHGLMRVATALEDVADGYALIELAGAIALREAGLRQPILMLEGFYAAEELPLFAEYDLTPVLHHPEQVRQFVDAALPVRLPVYLKLNTGMNRLGLGREDFRSALATLAATGVASEITVMSHFADADDPLGIDFQMQRLAGFTAGLALPRSLANSAALLRFPETAADWARPGIMLYGGSPFPEIGAADLGLAPVMSLESELIGVQELQAGDRVGYGGTFTAERPMRVGIVACGYADGYPRHAPTGTPVLVGRRRTRTLGRVSMDKICVDLADAPDATVGTPVLLWGRNQGGRLDADAVAAAAGTVSYELFCALAPRVPVTMEDGA